MFVVIVLFHVLAALVLILVVLLQVGKGQSVGAAFGVAGSSETLFGSRGPATFLSRLTTIAAALFMLTSLSLAYLSSGARQRSSITPQIPPATESMPAPAIPTVPTPATEGPSTPSPTSESTPALPTTEAPSTSPAPDPTAATTETPPAAPTPAQPPTTTESAPAPVQPSTQPMGESSGGTRQ
jgi:preprotein translocase subunit SecG